MNIGFWISLGMVLIGGAYAFIIFIKIKSVFK